MFRDSLKDDLLQVDFLPLLAVRAGDTLGVENWDGPGDLSVPTYAAALFIAPDPSLLGLHISPVVQLMTACVVGITGDGWGWIPIDANMKNLIIDALEAHGARPGEWCRLTITYTNPLKLVESEGSKP